VSDVRALEALYRDEGHRLWRLLMGVTGGRREIAEDAVAEAFGRAIQRPNHIRDPKAWIYRTALRVAWAELRTEARSREPQFEYPWERDLDGLQDLLQALGALTAHQRTAVILRYEQELPVAEVARLMGIASATVRVHAYRGRVKLTQMLGTTKEKEAP
jgi:RNA polymerase sigma-70 factor, ECF subfamily